MNQIITAIDYMLDKGIPDPEERAELKDQLRLIEQIPGGVDLLRAKLGGIDPFAPPPRQEQARGGLARGAQALMSQGRGMDSELVHMSPEEFAALRAMWGEPTINPDTGLSEFGFFSGIFKGIKKAVSGIWKGVKKVFKSPVFQAIAPIVLNIVAPGLGTALGAALGASASWAPIVGNALISGGISAVGGGDFAKGAIAGGIAGGGGSMLGNSMGFSGATANLVGSATAGAIGSSLTGGSPMQGAIQGGLGAAAQNYLSTPGVAGNPELEGPPAPPSVSDSGAGAGVSSVEPSSNSNWMDKAMKGASVLSALSSSQQQPQQIVFDPQSQGNFGQPLPQLTFDRSLNPEEEPSDVDYYASYGQTGTESPGELNFYDYNTVPGGATGGYYNRVGGHYYQGPGSGREDLIDAKLSDGEYVMDAETVSLLGDGSSAAGARRLDELRRNLRKHKAQQMSKGRFSRNAKPPHMYMARGGAVTRQLSTSQLVEIMAQEKQR